MNQKQIKFIKRALGITLLLGLVLSVISTYGMNRATRAFPGLTKALPKAARLTTKITPGKFINLSNPAQPVKFNHAGPAHLFAHQGNSTFGTGMGNPSGMAQMPAIFETEVTPAQPGQLHTINNVLSKQAEPKNYTQEQANAVIAAAKFDDEPLHNIRPFPSENFVAQEVAHAQPAAQESGQGMADVVASQEVAAVESKQAAEQDLSDDTQSATEAAEEYSKNVFGNGRPAQVMPHTFDVDAYMNRFGYVPSVDAVKQDAATQLPQAAEQDLSDLPPLEDVIDEEPAQEVAQKASAVKTEVQVPEAQIEAEIIKPQLQAVAAEPIELAVERVEQSAADLVPETVIDVVPTAVHVTPVVDAPVQAPALAEEFIPEPLVVADRAPTAMDAIPEVVEPAMEQAEAMPLVIEGDALQLPKIHTGLRATENIDANVYDAQMFNGRVVPEQADQIPFKKGFAPHGKMAKLKRKKYTKGGINRLQAAGPEIAIKGEVGTTKKIKANGKLKADRSSVDVAKKAKTKNRRAVKAKLQVPPMDPKDAQELARKRANIRLKWEQQVKEDARKARLEREEARKKEQERINKLAQDRLAQREKRVQERLKEQEQKRKDAARARAERREKEIKAEQDERVPQGTVEIRRELLHIRHTPEQPRVEPRIRRPVRRPVVDAERPRPVDPIRRPVRPQIDPVRRPVVEPDVDQRRRPVRPNPARPEPVEGRRHPVRTEPERFVEPREEVDPRRRPVDPEVDPRRRLVDPEQDPRRRPARPEVDPRRRPARPEVDPRRRPVRPEVDPRRPIDPRPRRPLRPELIRLALPLGGMYPPRPQVNPRPQPTETVDPEMETPHHVDPTPVTPEPTPRARLADPVITHGPRQNALDILDLLRKDLESAYQYRFYGRSIQQNQLQRVLKLSLTAPVKACIVEAVESYEKHDLRVPDLYAQFHTLYHRVKEVVVTAYGSTAIPLR